jgi:hypothetical protein
MKELLCNVYNENTVVSVSATCSTSTPRPGAASYFLQLDASLTIYLADNRGIGGSSPIGCPITAAKFAMPYWFNASEADLYTACNAEVKAEVGDKAIYYSTHYATLDYIALFNNLRATGTTQLAVYCLSYGTYFCNSEWQSHSPATCMFALFT